MKGEFSVHLVGLLALCSLLFAGDTLGAAEIKQPHGDRSSGAAQIRVATPPLKLTAQPASLAQPAPLEQPAPTVQPAPPVAKPKRESQKCVSPADLHDSIKPISAISLETRTSQELRPADCFSSAFPEEVQPVMMFGPRNDSQYFYHWQASGLAHQPLYFEDVALERYGKGHHPLVQPFDSGVKFYSQWLLLPYQMGLDRPRELDYTLGYYRSGSWAPDVRQRLPWSWKGATMQAGAVAGAMYMFPIH